ncbi:MAG TPA: hypothetical protein GXX63_02130 [Tissierellia bacterium]|nr:hypothetical protein [Tissierellia bacterium]
MKKFEKRWENYNKKWIKILTEGKMEKEEEFKEINNNAITTPLAIMEYRQKLMNEGRGQDFTREEIIALNNLDINVMQKILEEMFLEPIPKSHIEYFYESATKRGYKDVKEALTELYDRHQIDKNNRFLTIALTI